MTNPQTLPEIVDSRDKPIALGAMLGKGGEGTVYEVRHTNSIAAKIYHSPLSEDRAAKIRAMAGMRTDALEKLTSWPVDLLKFKRTGQPAGLLMPRITDKKNVHQLYGPKSRLQDFPQADWRFLLRASTNVAKAFALIHDNNCVIGDVNHGSIMVAQDATVSLIDCDSFQISTAARRFLCEVGIETFTPPELQGKSFRGVVRTPDFDNFGLAVVIFHLLFMGRHPFAGRYSGPGDMPIRTAIREGRFPYSAKHKQMQMERPPGTPELSFVGAEVARLFETAFSKDTVPGGRPTARMWIAGLQNLERNTKQCSINRSHWHPAHLSTCPWCRMEEQGANPLFSFTVIPTHNRDASPFAVEALWQEIQNLAPLGPPPLIPSSPAFPSPIAIRARLQKNVRISIRLAISVTVFLGGIWAFPSGALGFGLVAIIIYLALHNIQSNGEVIKQLERSHLDAEADLRRINAEWQKLAGERDFLEAKLKFETVRATLNALATTRAKELEKANKNNRVLQLDRFLDRFALEHVKLEGIGPGRKRILESYGIETAKDISLVRLASVPGFGRTIGGRLLSWRHSLEAKFVFDSQKAVDPRDIAKIDLAIQNSQLKLRAEAKMAHDNAMQLHARILATRQQMKPQMEARHRLAAQARTDYEFVKR